MVLQHNSIETVRMGIEVKELNLYSLEITATLNNAVLITCCKL